MRWTAVDPGGSRQHGPQSERAPDRAPRSPGSHAPGAGHHRGVTAVQSVARAEPAATASCPCPGPTAAWTLRLADAQAWEVKLIKPDPQEIVCGQNYGRPCTSRPTRSRPRPSASWCRSTGVTTCTTPPTRRPASDRRVGDAERRRRARPRRRRRARPRRRRRARPRRRRRARPRRRRRARPRRRRRARPRRRRQRDAVRDPVETPSETPTETPAPTDGPPPSLPSGGPGAPVEGSPRCSRRRSPPSAVRPAGPTRPARRPPTADDQSSGVLPNTGGVPARTPGPRRAGDRRRRRPDPARTPTYLLTLVHGASQV